MLVTKPIEDVINGVAGIAIVRSQSIQGLSIITAVLAPGTDIFRARQALAERLVEAVPRLPRSVPPPVISPLTSSSSTVLVIGFTSKTRSLLEQRTVVDWMVRPRLLATPGVAKVASFGGEVRQLQVQVDPARLRAYGVGLGELTDAARRATGVRGGGVIDGPNQRIVVRSEGQSLTPEAIGQVVVRERDGSVLRIGDVARVVAAGAPKFGDGAINGEPAIVTVVSAQLGAQHQGGGRRGRGGARGAGTGARARGHHAPRRRLPARDVHRPGAPQHHHVAAAGRAAGVRRPDALPRRPAHRGDLAHRHPALAALGDHPARGARLLHQHADAGRARHRARRGGGRRDHRRGEHRPAPAGAAARRPEPDIGEVVVRGVARGARQRGVRHVRGGAGVPAGAGAHRRAGRAVPAARRWPTSSPRSPRWSWRSR